MKSTRRHFARQIAAATGALSLSALVNPIMAASGQRKKIVCVGGHPDDPESGCGGTLARLVQAGHQVTIIYLTNGEAGIPGKSHEEAARIRRAEAQAAAAILGARPVFAGQTDGDTVVDNLWVDKIRHLITEENPQLVFTHWPIDSHKDHQAASLLTIQSWIRSSRSFDLYFFEVCTGAQTVGFKPTDYIDISSTRDQKRKAVYCHQSQIPDSIYKAPDCNHQMMEDFRGIEIGVPAAEAFVHAGGRPGVSLLDS